MLAVCDTIPPVLHLVRGTGQSLDVASVRCIAQLCNQSWRAGAKAILVDLGSPLQCEFASVAELVEMYRNLSGRVRFRFCNPGASIVAKICSVGLDRVLPMEASVQEALAEPSLRELQLVGLRAIILCAGTGSRMQPMTRVVPTPLLDIAGRPVLAHVLAHLERFGLNDVALNLGHLGPQIPAYFKSAGRSRQSLFFLSEGTNRPDGWSAAPLGSMTTLARFAQSHFAFLDDTFVLCGDALIDIDLPAMLACHRSSGAAVTIAAQKAHPGEEGRHGSLVTDSSGRITGVQARPERHEAVPGLANTGIYLFRPDVLDTLREVPGQDIAKDLLPALMQAGEPLQAFCEPFSWTDIGCGRDYYRAVAKVLSRQLHHVEPFGRQLQPDVWAAPGATVSPLAEIEGPCHIGAGATVEAGARLVGPCMIGPNSVIETRALVRESLVWSGSLVSSGTWVDRMIAGPDWAFFHHSADGSSKPCPPLDGVVRNTSDPIQAPDRARMAS